MPRISLTTFLFNDSQDSVEKTRRLGKYATDPGGGDYYWGVKEAAKRLFLDDAPYDAAIAAMVNIASGKKRSDNEAALMKLYQWKLKHPGSPLALPMGEVKGPLGELIVTLKPTYAWLAKGRKEAYVLWTYKDQRLAPRLAGMGVYLLEQSLKKDAFADFDFYLLDGETGKRSGHSCLTKSTPAAAQMALKYQEELFVMAKKAA